MTRTPSVEDQLFSFLAGDDVEYVLAALAAAVRTKADHCGQDDESVADAISLTQQATEIEALVRRFYGQEAGQ